MKQIVRIGAECGVIQNLSFNTHHGGDVESISESESQTMVFKPCNPRYTDYTPCQDQKRAMTFPRNDMIYRERHCPPEEEKLHCLIPALKGYVTPFPWPKSRDFVPYANAPYGLGMKFFIGLPLMKRGTFILIPLPVAYDADHPNSEVIVSVDGDSIKQQEEELRRRIELEAEERKLEETLEFQRRMENEAKQRHLAEQHKKETYHEKVEEAIHDASLKFDSVDLDASEQSKPSMQGALLMKELLGVVFFLLNEEEEQENKRVLSNFDEKHQFSSSPRESAEVGSSLTEGGLKEVHSSSSKFQN
ncbi:hypothetical protein CsatA_003234 [Cannabis sativa]